VISLEERVSELEGELVINVGLIEDLELRNGNLSEKCMGLKGRYKDKKAELKEVSKAKKAGDREVRGVRCEVEVLEGEVGVEREKFEKIFKKSERMRLDYAKVDIKNQQLVEDFRGSEKKIKDMGVDLGRIRESYIKCKENIGDCINMFHNKDHKLKPKQIDAFTCLLMRE
jgi:chromosome segregation ATPase